MTQTTLIDAAEDVFLRQGFEAASVEQITEAAGFSRGAFYSNFTDKDDLALAVLDKRKSDLARALGNLQRISDPAEQKAAVRDWFAKQWRQTTWIALRAELSRCAQRNPALESRLAELCRQEVQTVARILPSGGNTQAVTALALIGTSHGLSSMGFHAAPDLHNLCEDAVRLVFDCLTASRTSPLLKVLP